MGIGRRHLPSCQWFNNPRGRNQPEFDPELHPACAPSSTLTEDMGAVVDDLRQIATDYGQRPYRMFSVVYKWSGGSVGRGKPTTIFEQEFLPTPKLTINGLVDRGYIRASVKDKPQEAGSVERGVISVIDISPRYTEDQIRQLFRSGADLDAGEVAFIEIAMDDRDGASERRRFTVDSVPTRHASKFYWSVELVRQELDRDRGGNAVDSATGKAVGATTPLWAR